MAIKIGKSSDGNLKKQFKVKKGEPVIARIIPPIGDLADKGVWNVYYAIEWGYKGSDGKMKPFQDVHSVNRQTKMVEVQSPCYLKREALIKAKDELAAKFKAGEASKEELEKAVAKVKQYNLDKKFYLNVKLLNGDIGLLKLNYKLMQCLKEEIKRLKAEGIDPRSVNNGRFFKFSATNETGALQDWNFNVTEHKQKIQTEQYGEVEQALVDVLDDATIGRLEGEAWELDKLYPKITVEQATRIVKEGASAVDDILGGNKKEEVKTEVKTEAKEEVKTEVKTEAKEEVKEEVKTEVKTEAKEEVKTEAKEEVKTEEVKIESNVESDEDYLKRIGAV